jgi:hypothetical protein
MTVSTPDVAMSPGFTGEPSGVTRRTPLPIGVVVSP